MLRIARLAARPVRSDREAGSPSRASSTRRVALALRRCGLRASVTRVRIRVTRLLRFRCHYY